MSAIVVMMVLLHFLWQGTAIAMIARVLAWIARHRCAGLGHDIHLAALVTCLAGVLVTTCYLRGSSAEPTYSSNEPVALTDPVGIGSVWAMRTVFVPESKVSYPKGTVKQSIVLWQASSVAPNVTTV